MITLGYIDPETKNEWLVEVGKFDEERNGYWAIRIDPNTLESIGNVFFAEMKELF